VGNGFPNAFALPPVFGGVDPEKEFGYSVEEVLEDKSEFGTFTLDWIVDHYPIISILKPVTRDETGYPEGGGRMEQTFIWQERMSCMERAASMAFGANADKDRIGT